MFMFNRLMEEAECVCAIEVLFCCLCLDQSSRPGTAFGDDSLGAVDGLHMSLPSHTTVRRVTGQHVWPPSFLIIPRDRQLHGISVSYNSKKWPDWH